MKIASYNIQNIFLRHVNLVYQNFDKKHVPWQKEFEALRLKEGKKELDFQRMRELADLLVLRSIKAKKSQYEHQPYSIENFKMIRISEEAIKHKVRVVSDVDPDVILLQEVESRAALLKFNQLIFKENSASDFKEFIHLDGNTNNGLGMGIMLKEGYRIRSIRSFSSEKDEDGSFLFTNDLQSYKIENPMGEFIYILCVQLSSDTELGVDLKKRMRQAKMVSKVYKELKILGNDFIVVLGTLNAPKYSKSISPILDSDMINISEFPNFEVEPDMGFDRRYYRMGAFKKGVNMEQYDYLLASPEMGNRIYRSGMNRKAIWPLTKPQWPTYNSLINERDAASEHPLIWMEIKWEANLNVLRKSA